MAGKGSEPSVDLGPARHAVDVLRWAKREKAKIDEAEKAARAEVERVMGECEVGTIDGVPHIRWPHIKSRKLSQATLKKFFPYAYAECIFVGESRRMDLIEIDPEETDDGNED